MSETFPTLHRRHHGIAWRYGPRFLPVLVGLLLAVLALAIATSLLDIVGSAPAEPAATAGVTMDFPEREIPPEWRWEPKSVEYQSMYRDGAEPRPRKAWIR